MAATTFVIGTAAVALQSATEIRRCELGCALVKTQGADSRIKRIQRLADSVCGLGLAGRAKCRKIAADRRSKTGRFCFFLHKILLIMLKLPTGGEIFELARIPGCRRVGNGEWSEGNLI